MTRKQRQITHILKKKKKQIKNQDPYITLAECEKQRNKYHSHWISLMDICTVRHAQSPKKKEKDGLVVL